MVVRFIRSVPLAALLIVALAGCPGSGGDIGATLPVTGKVTVDDKPLADGNVAFFPDAAKGNTTKAAVGGIVKNGQYTLVSATSTSNANGAPAGWYKVTISAGMAMTGTGNVVTDPAKDKGKPTLTPTETKSEPIAEKYKDPKTTPLEVEVKAGGSYDLKATSR